MSWLREPCHCYSDCWNLDFRLDGTNARAIEPDKVVKLSLDYHGQINLFRPYI